MYEIHLFDYTEQLRTNYMKHFQNKVIKNIVDAYIRNIDHYKNNLEEIGRSACEYEETLYNH